MAEEPSARRTPQLPRSLVDAFVKYSAAKTAAATVATAATTSGQCFIDDDSIP